MLLDITDAGIRAIRAIESTVVKEACFLCKQIEKYLSRLHKNVNHFLFPERMKVCATVKKKIY